MANSWLVRILKTSSLGPFSSARMGLIWGYGKVIIMQERKEGEESCCDGKGRKERRESKGKQEARTQDGPGKGAAR